MTNPVVLIATHKRWAITCLTIESLLAQSVTPQIILVVSEATEYVRYSDRFPLVTVIAADNEPIGAKWQAGVVQAIDANPLIICGSDDILGPGFIERACQLIEEGNHFVGLQRWWIHQDDTAYLCDYKAKLPLGGGRVYSRKMLEKLEYKLFDISKDRHLDDYAWRRVRASELKVKWIRDTEKAGMEIHAVKGDWPMMNKFNPYHENVDVVRKSKSEKVLPILWTK